MVRMLRRAVSRIAKLVINKRATGYESSNRSEWSNRCLNHWLVTK
jgi:hypothetical protein